MLAAESVARAIPPPSIRRGAEASFGIYSVPMIAPRKSAFEQTALFAEMSGKLARVLPTLGEQSDIRYVGTTVGSLLNGPETTGMGYWSINPYTGCAFGCAYCYARYAHRYAMERAVTGERLDDGTLDDVTKMPPWLAFERRIFVKRNAADVLRRTLRYGSARHVALVEGESVVIGTATDPYQPAERKFRITRSVLEVLSEHPGMSVVIITKSPLITRDIDLLSRIARHSAVTVHLSLITLDRELARRIEPRAPTPESRLRALVRLREAGIDAGVNVMPILPGITDNPTALEALVKRIGEAGATYAAACALRLQSSARQRYMPFIAEEFPHLLDRYMATYGGGRHAGERYRRGLDRVFRRLCARYGVRAFTYDTGADDEAEPAEEKTDLQLQLGI